MHETSKLSIEEVIQILKAYYKIDNIKSVSEITEGASSECFHIRTDTNEYLFKDVEMIFINHPQNEALINNILSENNIPVSKFYKNINDLYLTQYKGHTCHLQSFIKGKILKPNSAPNWFLAESPKMLAKIHKALESIPLLEYGINEDFFKFMSPSAARISYSKSLEFAIQSNNLQHQEDIKYRLSLLNKITNIKPDMRKFTYKNTHGDYFISQILCSDSSINAVIDFTSACVHPVSYEIIRSYSFADPKCSDGSINIQNLINYIKSYLEFNSLTKYDIEMMSHLYFYQLVVCDYFAQYYASNNTNKEILSYYAHWSTLLCRWLETNIDRLAQSLNASFHNY